MPAYVKFPSVRLRFNYRSILNQYKQIEKTEQISCLNPLSTNFLSKRMPKKAQREKFIGVACALSVVVLWSGFLILSRYGAARTLTAYDLAGLRFGVSGIIMLPFLIRNGFGGLKPAQIATISLTAGPFFALCAYAGLSLAPAAHGAVLLPGTLPLFTTLLAVLFFRETLGANRIFSLVMILGGIGLMAKDSLAFSAPGQGWGDLFFICGSISWAIFTVLARAWQITPLKATAVIAVMSMVVYIPIYILFLPSTLLTAPLNEVLLQGIYQGFFVVIVALLAYTRAISALGPIVTTMITAATPGIAASAAVPLLGEPISSAVGIGIILVTAGMVGAVIGLHRSDDKKSRG